MKQDSVTVSFDAERLKAVKLYMGKKKIVLETELADQLRRLYEKYVPVSVREYIEQAETMDVSQVQGREAGAQEKKKA
jgi:hypothetical protein